MIFTIFLIAQAMDDSGFDPACFVKGIYVEIGAAAFFEGILFKTVKIGSDLIVGFFISMMTAWGTGSDYIPNMDDAPPVKSCLSR